MEKITKKNFIEMLCNNGSVFITSRFNASDEYIESHISELTVEMINNAKRRTVTENHSSYIKFSNGSIIDFNQIGKHDYFRHRSTKGVYYIIQRNTSHDDFDNMDYQSYIVYAIPDMSVEPEAAEQITESITTKNGKTYQAVEKLPDGWKIIGGTVTHPDGYVWIYNGEPRFIKNENGEYAYNKNRKIMLLKNIENFKK